MSETTESSDLYAALLFVVNEIRKWIAKPMPYADFKDQVVEECKVEFGNVIRGQISAMNAWKILTWIFGLWPILGWYFQLLLNFSWFGVAQTEFFYVSVPYMDEYYDCLQRSEVTEFSADNFETEYWFQKKYIEEHVAKVMANGKPTFQSKEASEMIVFYEGMLEYYGLPLVLPVE